MKKHLPFLLAAAVPFLLMAGMTADQLRVVRFGFPVRVPVVPVDPMSLFSGEYARLSFEFSNLGAERLAAMGIDPPGPAPAGPPGTGSPFEEDSRFRKGDRVWIVLSPGPDSLWHPVRLGRGIPVTETANEVAVRCEVRGFSSYWGPVHDNATRRATDQWRWNASLVLKTGLESFFVPQGEAVGIENAQRRREVSAEIAILSSGRAAVRRLFVQGREVRF